MYKDETFSKILFSDLAGVILAYLLFYFFLGPLHLETILLGVVFLLALNFIKVKRSLLIYLVFVVSCLFSQQRTLFLNFKNLKGLEVSVKKTRDKPLRNGVLAEKAKLIDYRFSRWSLHERVDVYHEKRRDEYIFYVNNKYWTFISPTPLNKPHFWFLDVLNKGEAFFDIGTGTGQSIIYANSKGANAYGIELNEATYNLVKDKFPDYYESLNLSGKYLLGEGIYHLRNSTKKYDLISLLFSNYSAQNLTEVLQQEKIFTLDGLKVILAALNKDGIVVYRTKGKRTSPGHATILILKNILQIQKSINPDTDYFLIQSRRGNDDNNVNINIFISPSKISSDRKAQLLELCNKEKRCEIIDLNNPRPNSFVQWDNEMVLNLIKSDDFSGKPINYYLKLILPTIICVFILFFFQSNIYSYTFTSLGLGLLYGGLQTTYIILLRDSFSNTFSSYYFVTFNMIIASIVAIIFSRYGTQIKLKTSLLGLFFFTMAQVFMTNTALRMILLFCSSFFSTISFYYLLKNSTKDSHQMVVISNNLGFILSYLVSLIYIAIYL